MAKQKAAAAAKPEKGSGAADKTAKAAAKAARKHERQVIKVEAQLADALEVRVALDTLIATLEERLRELRGQSAPAAAAPAKPATAARGAAAPRRTRASASTGGTRRASATRRTSGTATRRARPKPPTSS